MSLFGIFSRFAGSEASGAVGREATALTKAAEKTGQEPHFHARAEDALTCGICNPDYFAPTAVHYGQEAHEIQAAARTPETVKKATPTLEDVFNHDELAIIRSRAEAAKSIPNVVLSPEEITSLGREYYGKGADRQDKILHLVVGPPGAGKSSVLVNPLAERYGAKVIDSDDIKPKFSAYGSGEGGGATAKASAQVAAEALRLGFQRGDNIVQPLLGGNVKRLQATIDAAQAQGYKVGVHLADLPPGEAARRVFTRGNLTNQKVPPEYVLNVVKDNPQKAFAEIVDKNKLFAHSHYDTNVPFGTPPNLVSRYPAADTV